MNISELKSIYKKWLYLENDLIVDLLYGVCICNLIDETNPVNLYLVGPPGSGKTELIQSISKFKRCYSMDSITPRTLLSGFGGREQAGKHSVLFKLKAKNIRIILIKEFTEILGMREDACREILSQFRAIADGYIDRDLGNDISLHWAGKLGFIAAVTPVIDRHKEVNTQLGERFIYFRMRTDDQTAITDKAQENSALVVQMKEELSTAACKFLSQFDPPPANLGVKIREDVKLQIAYLARIGAVVRSSVPRNIFDKTLDYIPETEVPTRLVQQLTNLAVGIAMAQGKDSVDGEIVKILKYVVVSSIHSIRNRIIRIMWQRRIVGESWTSQSTIWMFTQIPRQTFDRYIEDMEMLGIIVRRRTGLNNEWVLSRRFADAIDSTGIYEDVDFIEPPEEGEWWVERNSDEGSSGG